MQDKMQIEPTTSSEHNVRNDLRRVSVISRPAFEQDDRSSSTETPFGYGSQCRFHM